MKIKSNVFKAALTVAMAFVLLFPCFMFKASAAGYKAGAVLAAGAGIAVAVILKKKKNK